MTNSNTDGTDEGSDENDSRTDETDSRTNGTDSDPDIADSTPGSPGSTTRRRLLSLAAGSAAAATAVGGLASSARAWKQRIVEFKGCSEVWLVASPGDLADGAALSRSKPPVWQVVVALPGGGTECREQYATHDAATRVPGQYGDSPVLKYAVDDGEKILGIVTYNRTDSPWADRLESPSCYVINEHRCANTPGTPAFESASCIPDGYVGMYECPDVSGNGGPGSGGHGTDDGGPGGPGTGGPEDGPGKGSGKKGGGEKGRGMGGPGKDGPGKGEGRDGSDRGDRGRGRGA
ncbi:hypothetical protein G9C85_16325 [Halorubellus sp. JP-L1]|uniref:hypothetical protein n=1 Tax=Halorubellus sp. JP-L1 TaxID=2715753 RepID=UPI00140CE743|nr:hypothetical protein [Halorubellus sp. JP-L1]NHN43184.1 hypothetical protein [Halorubellus sp. JP-L1]